jgi:thiosulfate/3-mercaptopyruvate sulfurtransferase
MIKSFKLALLLILASPVARSADMPPLVDTEWLAANLGRGDLTVLDIQDAKDYARFHVPGAVNAHYPKWRTGEKDPAGPSMLPPVGLLEAMIGELGIGNEQSVVIVATGRGAGDLAAATRVFWTFRILGHGPVAVLDGGLAAWAQSRKPLESGVNQPEPRRFTAAPDADLMLTADRAKVLLEEGRGFVDARTEGEFVGLYRGSDAERPGTIPGARHLPHDWLTKDGSAQLRDTDSLRTLFAARKIPTDEGQIHFCHSGNRAALNWFVDYAVLGNRDARLYDGSTMEWARRPELPLQQHIQLCGPNSRC